MNTWVPFLAGLVSLVFAASVFDQYLARRKAHQLVWFIGLLCFFLSTGAEFWTSAFGLATPVYRVWYLFGAVFTAAYLGMGTIYLLASRRAAHTVMALLFLASLLAIYRVVTAPVDLAAITGPTLSGAGFPSGWGGPRLLTPFFNSFGSLALIGGALYSAWVFWRRRIMPHRVVSNVLIAGGGLHAPPGG